MKALVALRYPLRKNQMKAIDKTLELLPKAKLTILHIDNGDAEKTKQAVLKHTGKKVDVVVESGDITRAINRVAKKVHADIVVLGKHRKNIVDSILDGIIETDTSAKLLKKIKRPVLVV